MISTDRKTRGLVAVTALLAGYCYLILVRPGIPYDEPSHFDIVEHYAFDHRLPVVGRSSATYEAYQPPLYYIVAASIYRLSILIGSQHFAFYALRATTLLLLPTLVILVYQITEDCTGSDFVATLAGTLVALNPSILAISSSVQNDSLAFVLATVSIYLCEHWSRARISTKRSFLLGAVCSAAILTKLSTLPIVGLVPLLVLHRRRFDGAKPVAIFFLTLALFTGWWFVRNREIYGDLTGSKGVEGFFGAGEKYRVLSLVSWFHASRSLVTYYSLPVEYWRNAVKAGVIARALVAGVFLFLVAGFLRRFVRWIYERRLPDGFARDRLSIYVLFALTGVAFWLAICVTSYAVAPRVGMSGLAGVAVFAAILLSAPGPYHARTSRGRIAFASIAIILLVLNFDMLASVRGVAPEIYEIPLSNVSTK